jgi:hypothetical protein
MLGVARRRRISRRTEATVPWLREQQRMIVIVSILNSTPTVVGLPAISPSAPTSGTPVAASNGTWTQSPANYTFQWYQCKSPSPCTKIAGVTGSTFTPSSSQVGYSLEVFVTAFNTSGAGIGHSPRTAPVS